MDDDSIGLVLARAAELRLKISNCIHKASLSPTKQNIEEEEKGVVVSNGDDKNPILKSDEEVGGGEEEEEEDCDEEADRLLHIHDALESLEGQLGNLQNLQQQQRYDREVALGEIEYSRKMLLEKLKEYKGQHFEVIHETSNFAGETVEHDNDLLLPPYPSRVPRSLIIDNGHLPQLHYTRKSVQNGVVTGEPINEAKKLNECDSNQGQTGSTASGKGFGHFIGLVAKTVFPLVGVVCVLSMTGFGQNLGKRSNPLKVLDIFQLPTIKEKRSIVQCPPGKFLVIENGEARCLVKERVEIPFVSVAAKPDINFGSG
ncbi:hypothetical protein EZV62_011473 [Acer yangbiense]|uniref:Plastid division protein PDV2 n=1 Tax=Acer yangbiense TaxID=1000413 RepID=A0A5C7I6P8_9ROSI|nr:hypothetical protein EZV62_011473 [Acer yangbiense]